MKLSLPLLHITLAAVFLTSSCDRSSAERERMVEQADRYVEYSEARRIFLSDSSRWQSPKAAEIAALKNRDKELKTKWRAMTFQESTGETAITLSRELTEHRQKLDAACANLSLLTEEAGKLWNEREASDWKGCSLRENDTGYEDPYLFHLKQTQKKRRDRKPPADGNSSTP